MKPASRIVTFSGAAASADRSAKPKEAARPAHLLLALPAAKAKQAAAAARPALTAKEAMIARAKAKQTGAGKGKAGGDAGEKGAGDAPTQLDADLLAAGWERAGDALRAAGEAAAALVDAWLDASNVEAIAAAADANDLPSSARKAARRALNVLKARGLAIPAAPRIVNLAEERVASLEATILPPDSSGTSAISVMSRDTSGRYRIAEVIVRESVGVLHAGSGWLSGSQLKEGRARALGSLGTAPVQIPVEWARHRIAQAKKLNALTGHVPPLQLDACRDMIEPAPEVAPPHPMADLEEQLTAEIVAEATTRSQALHDEPEFRTWLPSRQALDEMLQKLGQRLGAGGSRDQDQVSTWLSEELNLATDRFFSPEVRDVLASRMRDSAISLRARKGDAAATQALAVARAVKAAGLITSPPREIPFLMAFFQKGLAVVAQQSGGQLRIPVPAGAVGNAPAEGEGEVAGGEAPAATGEAQETPGGG